MKLYLILSSLLVPMALAAQESTVVNKVIFHDGHFITSSKENYISYTFSHPSLVIHFDHEHMVVLGNDTVKIRKEGLNFVVESLRDAEGKRLEQFDSIKESSPSLRILINSYQGDVRVRELTSAEKKEIEASKKAPEGASKNCQVSYNKGTLTTKSVGLEQFAVRPSPLFFIVNFSVDKKLSTITVKNYKEKQFTVERTESQGNCKETTVKDLAVAFCAGTIQVVELKKD